MGLKFFSRASTRDLELAIRVLSESRRIQTDDSRLLIAETVDHLATILRGTAEQFQRIDAVLAAIEHDAAIVLSDGSTLAAGMGNRERRAAVEASRDRLVLLLEAREAERAARRESARKEAAEAKARETMVEIAPADALTELPAPELVP